MPYVNSTAIAQIEYNSSSHRLQIWFRESGGPYTYFNVPEKAYLAFLASPSKGQYFNDHIRDRYSRA